jgi:hypothetical protein
MYSYFVLLQQIIKPSNDPLNQSYYGYVSLLLVATGESEQFEQNFEDTTICCCSCMILYLGPSFSGLELFCGSFFPMCLEVSNGCSGLFCLSRIAL